MLKQRMSESVSRSLGHLNYPSDRFTLSHIYGIKKSERQFCTLGHYFLEITRPGQSRTANLAIKRENTLQMDAVSICLKLKELWEQGYIVIP